MSSTQSQSQNQKYHILLLGATGRTGSLILTTALERGHTVTALIRLSSTSNSSLAPHPNLTIVHGTPTNHSDLVHALSSSPSPSAGPVTHIITALNARRASDSPFAAPVGSPSLMTDIHKDLISIIKSGDFPAVEKLIVLSAFGVADSAPNAGLVMGLLFRGTQMKVQYADHDGVDGLVKCELGSAENAQGEGMKYVLVRPMRLTDGEGAEVKDRGDRGEKGCMSGMVFLGGVLRGFWLVLLRARSGMGGRL